jgi:hypothetical protein
MTGMPQISAIAVLQMAIAGAFLYILLRVLRRGLEILPFRKVRRGCLRIFPLFESFTWLYYFVWSLGLFLQERLSYSIALWIVGASIAVWLSWFCLKDAVAGIVVKLQDADEGAVRLRVGSVEGRVRSMGYLTVLIELDSGETVRLPYSRIVGEPRWKRRLEEITNQHRFEITTVKDADVAVTLRKLRTSVLNSPWSSAREEPRVSLLRDEDRTYTFEVVVRGLGQKSLLAMEADMRTLYETGPALASGEPAKAGRD